MDKCYTKSLKLHWQCIDQVVNYDKYRVQCADKKEALVSALSEKWSKGAINKEVKVEVVKTETKVVVDGEADK